MWSVWDNNPIVSWDYDGVRRSVDMEVPPASAAVLPKHGLVSIVGTYDALGSTNLRTYFPDGRLCRSYQAPNLGEMSQFATVLELPTGQLEVVIGYQSDGVWHDVAGQLDLASGEVSNIRRGY